MGYGRRPERERRTRQDSHGVMAWQRGKGSGAAQRPAPGPETPEGEEGAYSEAKAGPGWFCPQGTCRSDSAETTEPQSQRSVLEVQKGKAQPKPRGGSWNAGPSNTLWSSTHRSTHALAPQSEGWSTISCHEKHAQGPLGTTRHSRSLGENSKAQG